METKTLLIQIVSIVYLEVMTSKRASITDRMLFDLILDYDNCDEIKEALERAKQDLHLYKLNKRKLNK